MTDSYQPIACSLHDEYEIAIMQKKTLELQWFDENGVGNSGEVLPVDIRVQDKQEFLVVQTKGNKTVTIRLDRIKILS